MRSLLRRSITLACCAATAIGWSGCEAKKVTEYVPGISTQVTVPRDLKWVRVAISVGGVPQFCQPYKVYDGHVLLPRSLGNFAATDATVGNGPVTYSIIGLLVDDDEKGAADIGVCAGGRVNEDKVRILRRSRQPYIQDKTLFLPMPLKYACYDKQCDESSGEKTCKGGKCVDATLSEADKKALKPFDQDLVDGTGGACFHAKACMTAPVTLPTGPAIVPALTAAIVNQDSCTYALANSASAAGLLLNGVNNPYYPGPSSGDGLNVQISWDGGIVKEILDLDPQEGFTIPDPAKPQQFKLAPGLCEMVKGFDDAGKPTAHRITSVHASGACRSKTIDQPLCADDQLAAMGADENGVAKDQGGICSVTQLQPPPAVLMIVTDNTTNHAAFFTSLAKTTFDPNDEDSLVQPAIKAALSDPAFERTDVGLLYAPGPNPTPLGCNAGPPDKAPVVAKNARDPILSDMTEKGKNLVSQPVALGGGLERAYEALRAGTYDTYFRRAVLVLANEGFDDATACAGKDPIARARSAANDTAKPIKTYVAQLTQDPKKPTDGSLWPADHLAQEGGTVAAAYRSKDAKAKFQELVDDLATCVYDVDPAVALKDGDTLAYTTPFPLDPTKDTTTLSFNAACSGDGVGTGQGWGRASVDPPTGKKRLYMCPDSCKTYRDVLKQTQEFVALYQQPPIAVPVFAYHTADKSVGCGPQTSR